MVDSVADVNGNLDLSLIINNHTSARLLKCREEDNTNMCTILYTGHFIMFSVITNIYNKKTNGPTLMELFTVTGKLKRFFDN